MADYGGRRGRGPPGYGRGRGRDFTPRGGRSDFGGRGGDFRGGRGRCALLARHHLLLSQPFIVLCDVHDQEPVGLITRWLTIIVLKTPQLSIKLLTLAHGRHGLVNDKPLCWDMSTRADSHHDHVMRRDFGGRGGGGRFAGGGGGRGALPRLHNLQTTAILCRSINVLISSHTSGATCHR